jgi:hypothetical protein
MRILTMRLELDSCGVDPNHFKEDISDLHAVGALVLHVKQR